VSKFIQTLAETHAVPSLLARLPELEKVQDWNIDDHDELEAIDIKFTELLLIAEKSAATSSTPWSPKLNTAHLIHQYWSVVKSSDRTHNDVSEQLQDIQDKLSPDVVYQGNKHRSAKYQLQLVRKNLVAVRLNVKQHRNEFLHIQQEEQVE
jgi:hypothetical protein